MQLSFDIEDKESELALTANFLMVNASDPESVTCDLLRFLHDSNARLTVFFITSTFVLLLSWFLTAIKFFNSSQALLNII